MNEYLAMSDLMTIDHRRQDGNKVVPPMRGDFHLVGPMVLRAPSTLEETPFIELAYTELGLSLFGMPLGFSYIAPEDTPMTDCVFDGRRVSIFGKAVAFSDT